MNGATRAPRVAFEFPKQVQRLERIRAAVQDVAHLHKVGLAAGPSQSRVDEACGLEDPHHPVVRAVDVADGDNSIDACEFAGRPGRRDGRRGRCNEEGGERRPGDRQTEWTVLHVRAG